MSKSWRNYLRTVLAWTMPATAVTTVWSPAVANNHDDSSLGPLNPGQRGLPMTFERQNYIDGAGTLRSAQEPSQPFEPP